MIEVGLTTKLIKAIRFLDGGSIVELYKPIIYLWISVYNQIEQTHNIAWEGCDYYFEWANRNTRVKCYNKVEWVKSENP